MATCSDGKASESGSCAGFLLSNLPDDVLVEILCRVTDRKHLTRLKSVCKSWSNLITDACVPKISASSPPQGFIYFVKKPRNGKPHNIDYFPCPMTPGVEPGPHEFVKSYSSLLPFQPTRNDFLDCCNGLLLFVEGCTLQYYVCNPMTKHCVAIPRGSMLENIVFASLAFDPSRSPHYRVVCFDYSQSSPPVRLHVFSSETGNWSMHETPFGYSFKNCKVVKRCIYLDGALYCISTSKHLVCFDLNRGNSRAIRLPQWKRLDPGGFGCAGPSRGRLCYSDLIGTTFYIWFLEDHCKNDRWTLIHSISVDSLGKHQHQLDMITISRFGKISALRPFALHPTSSDVIFFGTPRVMLSYHLQDRRFKLIYRVREDMQILLGQLLVFPYTPCLVNLKHFG